MLLNTYYMYTQLVFEVVSFDDLLKNSDFISTMVPLNKHTKGLLNKDVTIYVYTSCIYVYTYMYT